jgi:mannose-6-phosphate isomerase-like protein (cupin superfamily)
MSGEAMKLLSIFVVAGFLVPLYASAKDKAEVFSGKSVASQLQALAQTAEASASGGATLGDYGSHAIKLSVRITSGGAEVHAHYDDVFVVTEGTATLVTGGTVLDANPGEDGETKGSGIQNGTSHTIVKGDIVHVPAGTPHRLIIAPGVVFGAVVVKVKEP